MFECSYATPSNYSGKLLEFRLQAHRVVLSSCSDYFRAMFTEPMRERHQDEIQLTGINAEGLELIIDYIYTSKLSLNLANIQTVLSTATHLQIVPVIGACSAYLKRQLDMINCVDVITLAENYALPRLRKFAYNHISQNFMNLTDKQLHRLTLEQVCSKASKGIHDFRLIIFLSSLIIYSVETIPSMLASFLF